MFFASRPIIRPRSGVSEIMGALLLIVVVIVAVAALASFLAIAQKNAQTRQSYLSSAANENLQVQFAQFNSTGSLFDTNPSIVATDTCNSGTSCSTTASATFSTNNAEDFVIGAAGIASGGLTIGTGYKVIGAPSPSPLAAEYRIYPTTQANTMLTFTTASAASWGIVADAIHSAPYGKISLDQDSSNVACPTTSCTTSMVTSNTNDVIYAVGMSDSPMSISSSPSLVWTPRASITFTQPGTPSTTYELQTWYAVWTFGGSISATISGAGTGDYITIFGVSGANTAYNNWEAVDLTIRNTNTANSQLTEIKAGTNWVTQWFSNGALYGLNHTGGKDNGPIWMPMPARGTEVVSLNFTTNNNEPNFPLRNESITFTLLTSLGNFFTTVYNPPTAVAQVGISTVSYQYFNRDVLSLDGSLSQPSNQSKIVSYVWSVRVPTIAAGCTTAAFGAVGDYATVALNGLNTRFFQEAFQNSTLQPLRSFCVTGPFEVSLSVTDSLGFISNSNWLALSPDPNTAPIAQLTASPSGTCGGSNAVISGRVFSLLGTAYPNAVVLVSHSGTATLNPSYTTGLTGSFSISITPCTAPVSVTLSVDGLPSQTFVFNS